MKVVRREDNGTPVKVVLKSGKDASVHRYHHWIFSGAIKKIYGEPSDGDLVEVFDNKDKYLATGHYQNGSISVRILSFQRERIDEQFYRNRIARALQWRELSGVTDGSTMYRLIHGEGDFLPGLIADLYGRVVVLQIHSAGMYRQRMVISNAIGDILGDSIDAIYDKSGSTLPSAFSAGHENRFLFGSSTPGEVTENGYRFLVNWIEGQKTGFFIDQRDNRRLAASFSGGKRVLNLFGYTGGFSVYTLSNAHSVDTVDSSAPATELAAKNIELNYGDTDNRSSIITADAFDYLEQCKGRYDMIIVDPPAFAKHGSAVANALQGYKKLNMKAIAAVSPGGLIMTFSCSQVVGRENFRRSVFVAAANVGRRVRIVSQLSQPPDHPVNLFHPESEYLKGYLLYVE